MRSGVLMVLVLLLLAGGALAQPYVVYDGNSDEQCSEVFETIRDLGSKHHIAIANPTAIQTEVKLTFVAQNVQAGREFYGIDVFFTNGFDTLFDAPPTVTQNDLGSAVEIAIEATATTGGGLPISPDTIRYVVIRLYIDASPFEEELFCLDSSATSSGDWQFTPGPAPTWEAHPDIPGQGTPACFYVEVWPNSDPVWLDCGSVGQWYQTIRFCDQMTLQWWVFPFYGNPSYLYNIQSGPGVIDSLSGLWTWTPSAADADQDITLSISLLYQYCDPDWLGPWPFESFTCEVTLHPGPNAPPSFANDHETEVTVSGQPLLMQCPVNDDDPCTDYTYTYFVPPGEPTPPIQCDPTTGEITYPANPGDTDTYNFALVVTEGQHADTTDVTLYHWDSPLCGDMNHDGSSDITDLTWIIGFAFKGGVSPSPPEAGNINCLAGVDISDITYLVKFMFASGPDPCDCQ